MKSKLLLVLRTQLHACLEVKMHSFLTPAVLPRGEETLVPNVKEAEWAPLPVLMR
jgi:hypothetical protein